MPQRLAPGIGEHGEEAARRPLGQRDESRCGEGIDGGPRMSALSARLPQQLPRIHPVRSGFQGLGDDPARKRPAEWPGSSASAPRDGRHLHAGRRSDAPGAFCV